MEYLAVNESALRWMEAANRTALEKEVTAKETTLLGYWERSLKNLSSEQRTVFTVIVIMVMVLALFGNVVTIITNIRREQRHLFRVCLLSLSFTDIAFVSITSVVYLSQFNTEFNSLWTLGELMCTLSPFVQTMSVLINSITLVAIALDRYMALVKVMKGKWEPSGWFCLTCVVLIWGLGAGISSPMLTLYGMYDIVVLTEDAQLPNVITGYYMSQICATDKSKNGYYFDIVFLIIFIPLLVGFMWLNGIIAKEIWTRRNPIRNSPTVKSTKASTTVAICSNDRKTLTTSISCAIERKSPATVFAPKCNCPQHPVSTTDDTEQSKKPTTCSPTVNEVTSNRRKRQLRMFKAIITIMAVFFICRLPMWIFLLIKMNGVANTGAYWNLHYSFGILAMFNAVLNPLMYTFVSETIRMTLFLKEHCVRLWVRPCKNRLKSVSCRKDSLEKEKHSSQSEAG